VGALGVEGMCNVDACFAFSTDYLYWTLLLGVAVALLDAVVEEIVLTLGISFRLVEWLDGADGRRFHDAAHVGVFVAASSLPLVLQFAHVHDVSFPADLLLNGLEGFYICFACSIEVKHLVPYASSRSHSALRTGVRGVLVARIYHVGLLEVGGLGVVVLVVVARWLRQLIGTSRCLLRSLLSFALQLHFIK